MDSQEFERLVAHYKNMSNDDIASIHANMKNLTDEARAAIIKVIENQKIDLARIRQEDAEDAFQLHEGRKVKAIKKEKRNNLLLKIFVILFIPITIFRVLAQPEQSAEHVYQTFLSVIIQGIFLFITLWVFSKIKKVVSKK